MVIPMDQTQVVRNPPTAEHLTSASWYTAGSPGTSVEGDVADLYAAPADITTPNIVTLANSSPGRYGVFIERNGTIISGGPIWTYALDFGTRRVSFGGAGFLSLLDRVIVEDDLEYTSIDQGAISKALIDYALARPGQALNPHSAHSGDHAHARPDVPEG